MRTDPRNGRRRTSVPRERRTIAVTSYGEAAGKEFHCWYCHFLCVTGRDNFGGGPHGANYTADGRDGASTSNPPRPTLGNPNTFRLRNKLPNGVTSILMKLDGSGNNVQINAVRTFSSSGCPGCGTLVWKV